MDDISRLVKYIPDSCRVFIDEPMSEHTTFKIGGCADAFICVDTEDDLKKVLSLLRDNDTHFIVLGNGSNMLVSDNGIRGAVIRLDGVFKRITEVSDGIICGSAAPLSSACIAAKNIGLSGLEFAYGIPGSVGGAVYMNAGAYGGEIKDVLKSVTHMTYDGKIESVASEKLELSYRHSVYTDHPAVILTAMFKLNRKNSEDIDSQMKDYMQRRKSKQPLEYPSAGSVFKRPEGYFAGALIEKCNLKGMVVGGAQVSEKHAGFIINKGGATCCDVQRLIEKIQNTVFKETGVTLECEIKVFE